MNKKYDGMTDNAEISWNGRAYIVTDISDPVLFDVFFDPHLDEVTKKMLRSINETNLQGKDLGDVIPCDCLNSRAIYALMNHITDVLENQAPNEPPVAKDGSMRGVIFAEEVLPDCIREAEEYLAEIGHEDTAREELFGSLNRKTIGWVWPVEIRINGEDSRLTDLKIDAVRKILEEMLYKEYKAGMW